MISFTISDIYHRFRIVLYFEELYFILGSLNEDHIEALLKELQVGGIDCYAYGITYIVPINYVYDGMNLYAHQEKGMMRRNPEVRFQADAITNLQNWENVVY